jgi:signal peptidase I
VISVLKTFIFLLEESKLKKTFTKIWQNELARTGILAGIMVITCRAFILESRYIPTVSMEPTLLKGDRFVSLRFPIVFGGLLGEGFKHGQIVVFDAFEGSKTLCESGNNAMIKRVIGIPGDTIQFQEGQVNGKTQTAVFRNGERLVEPFIKGVTKFPVSGPVQIGKTLITNTTIQPGYVFVLGDNRENSCDSRFMGQVPMSKVVSRAEFRYFPLNRIGLIQK